MFDLTFEERRVVIFLSVAILIGIGADFFIKTNARAKELSVSAQDLGKIDLNTADQETLMSVSGIGEKIARRILEYRQENSGFSEIRELKNVPGLNNYRYDKVKDAFVLSK